MLRQQSRELPQMMENWKNSRKKLAVGGEYGKDRIWPKNTIPYEFNENVPRGLRTTIQQAMHEWQKETCLRFEPYKTEGLVKQLGHEGKMVFQTTVPGECNAKLGFMNPQVWNGETNTVNLGGGSIGCGYKRVILHEIGHG